MRVTLEGRLIPDHAEKTLGIGRHELVIIAQCLSIGVGGVLVRSQTGARHGGQVDADIPSGVSDRHDPGTRPSLPAHLDRRVSTGTIVWHAVGQHVADGPGRTPVQHIDDLVRTLVRDLSGKIGPLRPGFPRPRDRDPDTLRIEENVPRPVGRHVHRLGQPGTVGQLCVLDVFDDPGTDLGFAGSAAFGFEVRQSDDRGQRLSDRRRQKSLIGRSVESVRVVLDQLSHLCHTEPAHDLRGQSVVLHPRHQASHAGQVPRLGHTGQLFQLFVQEDTVFGADGAGQFGRRHDSQAGAGLSAGTDGQVEIGPDPHLFDRAGKRVGEDIGDIVELDGVRGERAAVELPAEQGVGVGPACFLQIPIKLVVALIVLRTAHQLVRISFDELGERIAIGEEKVHIREAGSGGNRDAQADLVGQALPDGPHPTSLVERLRIVDIGALDLGIERLESLGQGRIAALAVQTADLGDIVQERPGVREVPGSDVVQHAVGPVDGGQRPLVQTVRQLQAAGAGKRLRTEKLLREVQRPARVPRTTQTQQLRAKRFDLIGKSTDQKSQFDVLAGQRRSAVTEDRELSIDAGADGLMLAVGGREIPLQTLDLMRQAVLQFGLIDPCGHIEQFLAGQINGALGLFGLAAALDGIGTPDLDRVDERPDLGQRELRIERRYELGIRADLDGGAPGIDGHVELVGNGHGTPPLGPDHVRVTAGHHIDDRRERDGGIGPGRGVPSVEGRIGGGGDGAGRLRRGQIDRVGRKARVEHAECVGRVARATLHVGLGAGGIDGREVVLSLRQGQIVPAKPLDGAEGRRSAVPRDAFHGVAVLEAIVELELALIVRQRRRQEERFLAPLHVGAHEILLLDGLQHRVVGVAVLLVTVALLILGRAKGFLGQELVALHAQR
ncbi:MAG: hypothetical protein MOGMAGMI_02048 [Candidatus Omnitrophica bacterium]|nr:hypothetical protein [Candidatus Omnitrophota bacterium]